MADDDIDNLLRGNVHAGEVDIEWTVMLLQYWQVERLCNAQFSPQHMRILGTPESLRHEAGHESGVEIDDQFMFIRDTDEQNFHCDIVLEIGISCLKSIVDSYCAGL